MKLIEVLNQIPKLNKEILMSAPKIDATEKEVSFYLKEYGVMIENAEIRNAMDSLDRLLEYLAHIEVDLCNIQENPYP